MEPPIYDGKIHPDKYIKEIVHIVILNKLQMNKKFLDITIENITSFDTLINALKEHISFTVFRNSCKRKLQILKYIPEREGGDTVNFIVNFRSLCRDAEITNQKNVKIFDEIVSEYSRLIRNDYVVALKNVVTGKYLSSCNKKYPQQDNNNVRVRVVVAHDQRIGENDKWCIEIVEYPPQELE
ncbi:hypothetical protein C1645_830838 [Glomus cerebriforme]|uniref:MIR domain-containing protein n=1 Tax=Glomus cerebriforme TaxID=658196 RepID=A0A397SGT4_9GLOM|nr:hypothetical protein C1645_830838 [Glomus cerebriforme]